MPHKWFLFIVLPMAQKRNVSWERSERLIKFTYTTLESYAFRSVLLFTQRGSALDAVSRSPSYAGPVTLSHVLHSSCWDADVRSSSAASLRRKQVVRTHNHQRDVGSTYPQLDAEPREIT